MMNPPEGLKYTAEDWRERREERAAIMERDGGLNRRHAESCADQLIDDLKLAVRKYKQDQRPKTQGGLF